VDTPKLLGGGAGSRFARKCRLLEMTVMWSVRDISSDPDNTIDGLGGMMESKAEPRPSAGFMHTVESINQLMAAYHLAVEVHRTAVSQSRDSRRTETAARQVSDALSAAHMQCRMDFAKERGWRLSQRAFTLAMLAHCRNHSRRAYNVEYHRSIINHPEYCRYGTSPYRPVAIITHSYAPLNDVLKYIEECGFQSEVLPWSWMHPRRCCAVVITARRTKIRPGG
jgi:hypothetical protein